MKKCRWRGIFVVQKGEGGTQGLAIHRCTDKEMRDIHERPVIAKLHTICAICCYEDKAE